MDPLFESARGLRADYARVDWAATALGPVEGWSRTLRATLDLVLNTRFPVTLFWGEDLILLYNEDYVATIGDKHPAALGARAADVFPEIWDEIGPRLEQVLSGGGSTWVENARLLLERHGFAEETFFTYSYSPVTDPTGCILGAIDIATETTEQVVDRRRLELLSRLSAELTDLETDGEAVDFAALVLRSAHRDLSAVAIDVPRSAASVVDPRLPVQTGELLGDLAVDETPAGRVARIRLGTGGRGRAPAVVTLLLNRHLPYDEAHEDFLRLIGGALTQALARVELRQTERRLAAGDRAMSETLQLSLLSPPAQADRLQVAVRYRAATELAQIGGDWYDSFPLVGGQLAVVVGDVSGHDRVAAAAMAQMRNLLRGVVLTGGGTPSVALAGLDAAVRRLDVRGFATAIMVQVDPAPATGALTGRWSNAGHPPPALLGTDGRVTLLARKPEIMLGVRVNPLRSNHELVLEPGASLVLYTDGLIERRDQDLDRGLRRLVQTLDGRQGLTAEELCDHVLAGIDDVAEDDVVLVVVQAAPDPGTGPARP